MQKSSCQSVCVCVTVKCKSTKHEEEKYYIILQHKQTETSYVKEDRGKNRVDSALDNQL